MNSSASAIDVGKNIMNAFGVLRRTYENLSKFFQELDNAAKDEGLVPITPNFFLRWRTEANYKAWAITTFIKLFQAKHDPSHSSLKGLRQGAVYGVEVAFAEDEVPHLHLSRFVYDVELRSWPRLPRPGDFSTFHRPRWDKNRFVIESRESYDVSTPLSAEVGSRHWGLKKAVVGHTPLIVVDSRDKIKTLILQPLKAIPAFD
jgi:hypothetical protein